MGQVLIGTSGYQYRHWRGVLYPEGLPQRLWLEHYAERFPTVEMNATFYRLPTADAVDRWRDVTPAGFRFAVKGSRYLTHMKRLTDVGRGLRRFFTPVLRFGEKLGPVLWQLPPQMRPDPERLEGFLSRLPPGVRFAVEFRSPEWYGDRISDVLDRHGAAFCEHDLVDARPPRVTGGFRYLRFHGRTGKYAGRYGAEALAEVARDLERWRGGGDAYVYFNNDVHGHAVLDAAALSRALGRDVPLATEGEPAHAG